MCPSGYYCPVWLSLHYWPVPRPPPGSSSDTVAVTFLHLNDVYEMNPIGGLGGLARITTLKKQLTAENPNTFALLAGDLVSPSAIGLAKIDGERLAGKQMIASVNHFLDFMTFGNHEFDIKESDLLDRLQESEFTWISSNVFDKNRQPFPSVVANQVLEASNGTAKARIGIFSLTINSARKDWVIYDNNLVDVAREQVRFLKQEKKVDIVVALTHLAYTEDIMLATAVPEIDLILGGHEHENMQFWRGGDFTPIFKADANARTAYVHRLTFNVKAKKLEIKSHLRTIGDRLEDDPETAKTVKYWVDLAYANFRKDGVEPTQVVATPTEVLDGREASIRNKETRLTQILALGFVDEAKAECSFYNSGTIRIDDEIPAGQTLTEYDILRILPFGGDVILTDMKGSFLKKVLDQGVANAGKGGFLQRGKIAPGKDGSWLVNDQALDPNRWYKVALSDFLLTGQEEGLNYLKPPNADFKVLETAGGVRQALTDRLKKEYPK